MRKLIIPVSLVLLYTSFTLDLQAQTGSSPGAATMEFSLYMKGPDLFPADFPALYHTTRLRLNALSPEVSGNARSTY